MPNQPNRLGEKLRRVRADKGLGLREVAAHAGVNHGYLSQLERGEIAQPAPQILHKLAGGYDEPFPVLMRWAGYIEEDPGQLPRNQARALKYMGNQDLTDQELKAIKAILDLRRQSAGFPIHVRLDGPIPANELRGIRQHAIALVREAAVLGHLPTPLDELARVANLVRAGDITLTLSEKRKLRQVFGDTVDTVLRRLQGAIHFPSGEFFVASGMNPRKQRFVEAHEIGHAILPWQREIFAYLDDEHNLCSDVRDRFEREANQTAIELLAQGDLLRREADDSTITSELIERLSEKYQISLQATSRRVVEESRQQCALAIAHRAYFSGPLMPYHLYCSATFEQRFRWKALPYNLFVTRAMQAATREDPPLPAIHRDAAGASVGLGLQVIDTPWAILLVFRPIPIAHAQAVPVLAVG
jgi:transcriptional regulator with XRE-family HTH domain